MLHPLDPTQLTSPINDQKDMILGRKQIIGLRNCFPTQATGWAIFAHQQNLFAYQKYPIFPQKNLPKLLLGKGPSGLKAYKTSRHYCMNSKW